jgi:hypothetical protein
MDPPRRLNAAVIFPLCDLLPKTFGPDYSPWARAMISLEIDSGTSL